VSGWRHLNVTVMKTADEGTVVVDPGGLEDDVPSVVVLRVSERQDGKPLLLKTVSRKPLTNAGVSQTDANELGLPGGGVDVTDCEYRGAHAGDFVSRRPLEAALLLVTFLGALGSAWLALDLAARDYNGVFWVAAAVFLLFWLGAVLTLGLGWAKLKSDKS